MSEFISLDNLTRRLSEWENGLLVVRIFTKTGEMLQKAFRRKKIFPLWFNAIFVSFLILLSGFLFSRVIENIEFSVEFVFPIAILFIAFTTGLSILLIRIINNYFRNVCNLIKDASSDESNVNDLLEWFNRYDNTIWQLIIGISFAIFGTVGAFQAASSNGIIVGFGIYFINLWGYVMGSQAFYLVFSILDFPLRVSKYKYKIYDIDPSNSIFIQKLSTIYNNLVFFFAIVGAIGIVLAGIFVPMTVFLKIGLILSSWIPIIALFIINQAAIHRIIMNAKWLKLASIQEKIIELEKSGNTAEKDTMDNMLRLMDYHDRVQETRDSTLNIRAFFNLFNSLFLTLISSLLSQLEKIITFLATLLK